MTTDLITFCCPKDIHRLHEPGALENLIQSHKYDFDNVIVIHQRCQGIECRSFDTQVNIVESENFVPQIWNEFGFTDRAANKIADKKTHGPNDPHYWRWHILNHLIGLKESNADYIVFNDCDCTIKSQGVGTNWIELGITLLEKYEDILIVSPGDGGLTVEARTPENYRLTQNVSQQLFLCKREVMLKVDFDYPWDGGHLVPTGSQAYYYLLEGRLWRWMHNHDLWRCILPDDIARYWHWGW